MNVDELRAKWLPTVRSSDHVFTWTGDNELCYVAEQASKASSAVEIGVYMGRSSKVMLDANPNLHLWCIDNFLVDGTCETTQHFLKKEIEQGRCELVRKYSRDAHFQLQHLSGKLDLLFIDGSHSYPDVITDLKLFVPLLRVGGVACGHDYEDTPKNDVAKAVEMYCFSNFTVPVQRVWQFIKNDDSPYR